MIKRLNPDDLSAWDTFVKDVTRLGEPVNDHIPPPLYVIEENPMLDLHGLTLVDAHRYTMDYVNGASGKYVMIITGLSGQIKKEFVHWFDNHKTVRKIEEMNGGGAYKIFFKKFDKSRGRR